MWHTTCGKVSRISTIAQLDFSTISLVSRWLPMSSTNKVWWVIWNAKRLPNMTQNSGRVPFGWLYKHLSSVVCIHYGAENEHKLQAWSLKIAQPCIDCKFQSKLSWKCWSIYGTWTDLWKFMGGRLEWEGTYRSVAPPHPQPSPHWAAVALSSY